MLRWLLAYLWTRISSAFSAARQQWRLPAPQNQLANPSPDTPFGQNPFENLPAEILLAIALQLPDLKSVLGLDSTSPAFATVFNAFGAEIIESAMESSLPLDTRRIIRLVVFIRCMKPSTSSPPLQAFLERHLRISSDVPNSCPIPVDSPPSVLRGVLATATKLTALTDACLAHYMRRCLALRPMHLVDKNSEYGWKRGRYPWQVNFEGEPYQPHSSGPPSWLEYHRALRAFWCVPLHIATNQAICQSKISPSRVKHPYTSFPCLYVYPFFSMCYRVDRQQLASVLEYLADIGWDLPFCEKKDSAPCTQPHQFRMPWPPEEKSFAWDNTGVGPYPGCNENWQFEPPANLDGIDEAPGQSFWYAMQVQSHSPLFGIAFCPFRRLGMAFWDSKRLMALQLLGPKERDGFQGSEDTEYFTDSDLFFAWKSIVSPEDLVAQGEKARKRMPDWGVV